MADIDQTRGHENNAAHARAVFFNTIRNMPPLVQVAAVQQLLRDLMTHEGGSDIGDRYSRAHRELLR